MFLKGFVNTSFYPDYEAPTVPNDIPRSIILPNQPFHPIRRKPNDVIKFIIVNK